MGNITFRLADSNDWRSIRSLLVSCVRPSADVAPGRQEFIVAEVQDRLIGAVGLEALGTDGLLRSLAVAPDARRLGVAADLCARMLAYAGNAGVGSLYLLTNTADRYFTKLGFVSVERTDVPESIRATEEFRTLCPSTAQCMRRSLRNTIRHYPRDLLPLRPDVPGAKAWGVALEHAMLTYFEVEPHSRFERHAHESEQITMVLEGWLLFETDAGEVVVGPGEVIAVPSNAPHAVFTRDSKVRAIDAWSPPLAQYAPRRG